MKKSISTILSVLLIATFAFPAFAAEPANTAEAAPLAGPVVVTEVTVTDTAPAATTEATAIDTMPAAEAVAATEVAVEEAAPAAETVDTVYVDDAAPLSGDAAKAYDLYLAAAKKMENKSVHMEGTMNMSVVLGEGTTTDVATKLSIIQLVNDKGELEMSAKITSDVVNVEEYYRDGFLYMSTGDIKTKTAMPFEAAMEDLNAMQNMDYTMDFFEGAEISTIEEGTVIRYTMTGSDIEEMMGGPIEDMFDGAEIALDDVVINNISVAVLIGNDGMLKKQAMNYDISMNVEGMSVQADYDLEMDVISVGKIRVIEYPNDLMFYNSVAM